MINIFSKFLKKRVGNRKLGDPPGIATGPVNSYPNIIPIRDPTVQNNRYLSAFFLSGCVLLRSAFVQKWGRTGHVTSSVLLTHSPNVTAFESYLLAPEPRRCLSYEWAVYGPRFSALVY
ncbi:hypothetical protein NPIL_141661 [Nephila pilipes]|uniref:Uncharacterized protein n=1 Tax=Nephila pilipes TaxID=299642 RepID=A0A8X6IDZ9_NEPPI|nr:hypothetical protein NPIL_141661 [Nephila pilipes]